ncbi:Uncharacterised protein [Streptococcus pyogenes]|nr:Uncharacterised protein [Streptococcus pyogenes]
MAVARAGGAVAVGVQLVLAGCGPDPPDGVGADAGALVAAERAGDDGRAAFGVGVGDGEAVALFAPFPDHGLLVGFDFEGPVRLLGGDREPDRVGRALFVVHPQVDGAVPAGREVPFALVDREERERQVREPRRRRAAPDFGGDEAAVGGSERGTEVPPSGDCVHGALVAVRAEETAVGGPGEASPAGAGVVSEAGVVGAGDAVRAELRARADTGQVGRCGAENGHRVSPIGVSMSTLR